MGRSEQISTKTCTYCGIAAPWVLQGNMMPLNEGDPMMPCLALPYSEDSLLISEDPGKQTVILILAWIGLNTVYKKATLPT